MGGNPGVAIVADESRAPASTTELSVNPGTVHSCAGLTE